MSRADADTGWTARAHEALRRTEIMALSTLSADGSSWTCPLQFQYDDDFTLYFASQPEAKHVKNIDADPRVSVAIYAVPGPPGGNLALQLTGIARRTSRAEGLGWQQFQIRPVECWCFDSRVDLKSHPVALA